ncbi:MAG TPA: GNAT family N-acetyltransferase [Bryobacteraceae bacterium]|nr:GNAT family N-acetyltransferase [Bryobacteraceae bacterium]
MVLETERLILEKWEPSDWEVFRPIATDPEVMRYITGGVPWTDEQIKAFVNRESQRYVERGYCRWRLLLKPGGEFIGFCGVGSFRDYPEPEIGWWLAPAYWGRGLATEAATVALRDALERVGLRRIVSVARPENVASTHIMEKIGLRLETPFEYDGLQLVRYAISRDPSPINR